MKQRIINKKLKNDVLINLWIKHWRHSINNCQNIMLNLTQKDYDDHTSIWYCRYKLYFDMMNKEFLQALKLGRKNHNIKTKQFYDWLLSKHFVSFHYNEYKKLFLLDITNL